MRLLTLTGPGGTGKTRLALETGHYLQQQTAAFADGVYFVELANVDRPELLISAVAETLGVKEAGGQSQIDDLKAFLRPRQTLLILDNFEQIVDAGQQLLLLLQAASELRMLVTSRMLLHVYGEHEFPVLPLPLPNQDHLPPPAQLLAYPAVALFVGRSQAARSGFVLTAENAAAVVEICTRLDGLPLAIELAAARSKLLAPAALLSQLCKSLDLTTQQRHISERQRTLRGAIEWSYRLLSEAEQQLYVRLGVFAGAFTVEAATAVVELSAAHSGNGSAEFDSGEMAVAGVVVADEETINAQLLDQLLALVDHSMLQQLDPIANEALPQFRLLLTLREFAVEQLLQRRELESTQVRHAYYYLALAKHAETKLNGPEQIIWLKRLEAAHDNLRTALAWSLERPPQKRLALALAASLGNFWKVHNHFTAGRRWLAQALADSEDAPLSLRAAALYAAGMLAYYYDDYAAARQCLTTSLLLWQTLGGRDEEVAAVSRLLGLTAWREEEFANATRYLEETLAIQHRLGRKDDAIRTQFNLGLIAQHRGNYDQATQQYQETLRDVQRTGHRWLEHLAYNSLGTSATDQGQYEQALAYLEKSLSIAQALGDQDGVTMVLTNLGNVNLHLGRLEEAQAIFNQCLEANQDAVRRSTSAFARFGLGMVELQKEQGAGTMDGRLAWEHLSAALTVWHGLGMKRVILRALDVSALFFVERGRAAEAMMLLGQAEILHENSGLAPRSPAFVPFYNQAIAAAHEQLDETAFAAAWTKGRTLTLDQMVALMSKTGEEVTQLNLSPSSHPNLPISQSPISSLRYIANQHIATGGMGEVFLGQDTTTGQDVVIERLRPDLVARHREAVERFIREGELLSQLNHPNIVRLLDSGEEDGRRFIVMEYVSGGTLRDLLEAGRPLPVERVVAIGLEMADALARAHHLGIIHRDLKPENVLLAADGTPRLTDFGLAYQRKHDPRLTEPGIVIGTVAYMSPEAHQGEDLDAAGDIWSLGVILYEMLTGRHPFERPGLSATLLAILHDPLPDWGALQGNVPAGLVDLFGRMLVKDRRERLGSARQVAAELEGI